MLEKSRLAASGRHGSSWSALASILQVVVVSSTSLLVPACEDNPDQIYQVAPKGAGGRWNDGEREGDFDPDARSSFLDNFNATSKQELCSGPVKQQRWAKMMKQPILPPQKIAGLDLAGGEGWTGLDFREAERTLCQSKTLSGTETDITASWGDGDEVTVVYKLSTNTITDWQLRNGFLGTLEFDSRPHDVEDPSKPNPLLADNDGKPHHYSIRVGQPILRDGETWELNWTKTNCAQNDCWDRQSVEMYDALMWTYAKELKSTQTSCIKQQTCLAKSWSDGTAAFGVRALGVYFHIPQINLPQPEPSRPDYLYGFYVKLMPFSASEMFLKLDDEGPVATTPLIGDKEQRPNCVQKLGLTYGDFLANCVDVFKDPKDTKLVRNKLLGGMSHDKEAFNFSIEGVNLDFASNSLGAHGTVGDNSLPEANDHAHEFEMDIRASGKVVNEYTRPVPMVGGACPAGLQPTADGRCDRQTLGGTGAVYREYVRRVQNDIHEKLKAWPAYASANRADGTCAQARGATCTRCEAGEELVDGTCKKACNPGYVPAGAHCSYVGFPIGAPECLGATPAKGCTGFETFVTPGSRDVYPDDNVLRVSMGPRAMELGYKTVLKAGDPQAVFCSDPSPNVSGKDLDPDGSPAICNADSDCWSDTCNADPDPSKPKRCANVMMQPRGARKYFNRCASGSLLDQSFTQVLNALADPNATDKALSLPPALRDRKYYFRHWAAALVKYLKAAPTWPEDLGRAEYGPGGDKCGPPAIAPSGCEPEPDHLLFDQIGLTGDRDKFEYIDRRFVAPGKEPMKLEYEILILSSNQQEWKFHRRMTRAEEALYGAMSTDRTKPLASGDDNVRITNLVGSPILSAGGWRGVPGNPKKDAHYCASTLLGDSLARDGQPDPECAAAGSNPPPSDSRTGRFLRDDAGQPLLTNYRGAFTGTVFSIGSNHLKLEQELPNIKSAKVKVPFFADPYATKGAAPTGASQTPTVLVDWRPKTPADGIRIPLNASRDRFIPSATVNFSGSSLELDVDYEELADRSMRIQGVQSDNYMGNLFLCQDPETNDLLTVEQYESADVILEWLKQHPGTRDKCSILIRWSASGVFPVMIAAKQAGMVLNVGVGSGVGRITSIEIYNPSLQ